MTFDARYKGRDATYRTEPWQDLAFFSGEGSQTVFQIGGSVPFTESVNLASIRLSTETAAGSAYEYHLFGGPSNRTWYGDYIGGMRAFCYKTAVRC